MKRLLKKLSQFIKFCAVGLSNTVVNQIVYMAALALGCHYVVASVLGFLISVLNAYFWQSRFVFKENENGEKRVWWQVLIKTYMAYGFTGLILNNLLLVLWIDVIGIESYTQPLTRLINNIGIGWDNSYVAQSISPFMNMLITIPLNFCINKFWAYRQKNKSE
ncbi:MAG: GtrA family protein [Oscillospiraceae bacterium]|nr:GtrA family protein [Oscillospiraceae bacterium]